MKRRAWLTLGAVVLAGGGVAGYAVADPAAGPAAEGQPKRPVQVYHLALKGTASGERELPRTDTEQFSLVGVTWTGALKKLEGTAQVRTRSLETGEWSPWRNLELDLSPPDEPDADMRGTSAPMWVGPSDGIEVQVLHEDGTTGVLPKGLDVTMVDPGVVTEAETRMSAPQPAAFAVQPDMAPVSSTAATAEGTTVPQPPVVSRAEWGADETRSPDPSEYNPDVKAVFVHHTAGAEYDCAESPAIVRGIYAYHTEPDNPNTQAKEGNGWNDIGYHFLVDKCGQIFEGRKGGIDKPVLGAHTYGFNRESTSVSVLGNYVSGAASDAALASVARVAAWKLSLAGADPAGTVELTAGATQKNYAGTQFYAGSKYPFDRISGHRDGMQTECPGNSLYAQLPKIRTWAAGPVQDLKVTSLTGATASGSTYYTKSSVTVRWSSTTPASLISRYEILVDGAVVATTSGAGSAKAVTLTPGSHTVAVRAVHVSGKPVETTPQTVVADTTAPTFTTTPKLSLRTGTVNTAAVPVTLNWKATDDKALRQVQLTSPQTAVFSAAATLSSRTVASGTASTWTMRATDYAGNYRDASAAYTPVILQESSAVRSGSWTTRSSTSYLGGKSYSSGAKGASLTWTFTGRSASWVVSRASGSGQVYVYVDGVKVSTVDLKSTSTLYRQAIWTKTWSTSAKHTVKIVVVGTAGRPTITTDGLVYLK
ncbi:peptidoglycan recognition protein family protein [Streptomyces sp. enrichment culture]|uniref:peptidoglycan recognition protein family protein n=1 Tax=Streptomyces sp. enrichment culture TaxID=1795815 RepID=UPI003F56510B